VEIGGDPRLIRDVVSRETDSTYSQRKYDNLTQYWLGGAPVMKSVQGLLEAFASLPGSRCLVIKDDDGVLARIVMQSSAQRALVQACGDTLVLDWTHNTNNRGFHLDALRNNQLHLTVCPSNISLITQGHWSPQLQTELVSRYSISFVFRSPARLWRPCSTFLLRILPVPKRRSSQW
jgi:hypothetical protein